MEFGEAMNIEELLDAGLGNSLATGTAWIERERCVRRGCRQKCEADTGFCTACLAWVKGEPVEDPRARDHDPAEEIVMPYPPEPHEEWNAYLQRARFNT